MMITCFLSAFLFHFAVAYNYTVTVNTMEPYFHPDPGHFLSMDIDQAIMIDSSDFSGTLANLASLVPLARPFQPARLRWGGWEQDYVKYNFFGNNTATGYHGGYSYVITADKLDQLYSFATNAGWELSYGLNLWGDFNLTEWDPTNTKQFLDYASSKGYKLNFELGQEPDLFPSPGIQGDKLAQAFGAFRELLNTYDLYKNTSLVQGPSIAIPLQYYKILTDFFSNGGGNHIDALSFHHYYGGDREECNNITTWTIPQYMDTLIPVLELMTNYSFRPLWLSETGTQFFCWNALTYVSGFFWLDKFGLTAKYRINQINRNSFYGIELGMVDPSLSPNPDYWLFLLYKKLVGAAVYNVTITPDDRTARLYAGSSTSDNTTVVIYGVNVNKVSTTVDLPQFSNGQATLYLFKESVAGNLASNLSTLNGDLLTWASHQPGPRFRKNFVNLPLVLPAYSQFYLVVNQTKYTTCPTGWYNEKTTANKCVIFKTRYTYPFFAARLECDIFGTNSSTLTIGSAFENSELLTQAKASGPGQFYIGLIRNGTNWVWSNGETSSYRNWAQGFPNNDSTKNCVTFSSTDGTWTNSDCDNSQSSICQLYF